MTVELKSTLYDVFLREVTVRLFFSSILVGVVNFSSQRGEQEGRKIEPYSLHWMSTSFTIWVTYDGLFFNG